MIDESDPHLFLGDFNAWVGEVSENHVTAHERTYIPTRRGDPNSDHQASPSIPSSASPWLTSNLRGQFYLDFVQHNELLIANGRFEHPSASIIPATLI